MRETTFGDGQTQTREPDKVGSLYETMAKNDREYGYGGQIEKRGAWRYKYNDDGFLVERYKGSGGLFGDKKERWRYRWDSTGMLQEVRRPDGERISFTYDALGRRLSKTFKNTTTRWLWDGNTPIHEFYNKRAQSQVYLNFVERS